MNVICGNDDLLQSSSCSSVALEHMRGMVALLKSGDTLSADGSRTISVHVCNALSQITVDDLCREAFCQTDGVEMLVEILGRTKSEGELQRSCVATLTTLAHSEGGRAAIMRSGYGGGAHGAQFTRGSSRQSFLVSSVSSASDAGEKANPTARPAPFASRSVRAHS